MRRTPIFGTATVATANTAAQLLTPPATSPPSGVVQVKQVSRLHIQADAANTAVVTIGTVNGQTWKLSATSLPLVLEASDNDFFNLYDFYVNSGTVNMAVNFIAVECLR